MIDASVVQLPDTVVSAGITGIVSLLVALTVLFGVLFRTRKDTAVGKDEVVEKSTVTLIQGLQEQFDTLNEEHLSLKGELKQLREFVETLQGQFREKMRAVSRVLFYLDRHLPEPLALEPIQDDLARISEDVQIPIRWETSPAQTEE